MILPHELHREVNFVETDGTVVFVRGKGGRSEELLFSSWRGSVLPEKRCPGDGWGEQLHGNVSVPKTPNCTLNHHQDDKRYIMYLSMNEVEIIL